MSLFTPLLAQSQTVDEIHESWLEVLGQNLLIVGAMAAVTLALLVWVVYFRRRVRKRRRHAHAWERTPEEHSSRRRHRRRTHQHPSQLPLNPTLAKSGGLPPIRPHPVDPPEAPPA
jgi:hypothetical protein